MKMVLLSEIYSLQMTGLENMPHVEQLTILDPFEK